MTNPYAWGDPRYAEWERSHAFIFGSIQPELPNTTQAPEWESMNRRTRRRRRRRLPGPRHRPVTTNDPVTLLEWHDTKNDDGVKEEDDIKSEPKTP
ncbi:hypothetical protein PG985_013778 [Apiospora marii]